MRIILALFFITSQLLAAPLFDQVNPERTNRHFTTHVHKALKILKDHPTKIARLTYQSIVTKKVKVDLLEDLNRHDFKKVLNDYKREDPSFPYTVSEYPNFVAKKSKLNSIFEKDMAGYMWDNRIYINLKQTPLALAQTLVHEVNHVINRSEDHYYDSQQDSLREEYRAFLAEAIFNKKRVHLKKVRSKILDHVIKLYQWPPSLKMKIRSFPRGHYLPNQSAWKKWQIKKIPSAI